MFINFVVIILCIEMRKDKIRVVLMVMVIVIVRLRNIRERCGYFLVWF
jgi:hypothetical protein